MAIVNRSLALLVSFFLASCSTTIPLSPPPPHLRTLPSIPTADAIPTLYGQDTTPSPVVQAVIASPIMQRLKSIGQFGPPSYHDHIPHLSRYDHSLGVYYLLKRFGASEQEQLAGLLHDASHTVFSHVADSIFSEGETDGLSFQDKIHTWYLTQFGLDKVVEPYGYTVPSLDPHGQDFPLLERDLPDLCADRIDYNIQTAYVLGLFSKKDVQQIIADLRYDNGIWYFVNPTSARKLAEISLHSTDKLFNTDYNAGLYNWYARIIKYAINKGYIHSNDFIFGTDRELIEKLDAIEDPYIQKLLKKSRNVQKELILTSSDQHHDIKWYTKFRGVDPWIKTSDGTMKRLTEIDADYNTLYTGIKEKVSHGIYFKEV